jgi:arabinan endo-1,5-alpha-L-arabinosidase
MSLPTLMLRTPLMAALAACCMLGACDADAEVHELDDAAGQPVESPVKDASTAESPRQSSDAAAAASDADRGVQPALDARADSAAAPDSGVSSQAEASTSDAGARADAAPEAGPSSPDAGGSQDRCDVAVLDPAKPPTALTLSGNLGTHDPALIEQDGTFYLFQTGPRVAAKTSTNLMSWQGAPSALGSANPAWIAGEVPGAKDLWAPDLSFFGGQYHLYYSVSTFGSNSSCIGHASRASMSSGSFRDQGSVVCSNHGSKDDWNAIDPNVVLDEAGAPWLVFGSFWSGIKAVALNSDGTRKDAALHALASRNGGPIEAPFVVRRCGYFYLFVSFDKCCDGANSTYNIRVGRSQKVLGPYLDQAGKPMLEGGGTLLVSTAGRWHGPGHNAVVFSGKRAYNVYHAYDANSGGASMLRVSELVWDAQGWPVSGGP